ncbi:MAG: RsbRD N-terminal domain-containing protein [Acidobacteriaceae bacterium]
MRTTTKTEKDAIAEEWLALLIQSFPPEGRHFLQLEKDPFRNPMGHALRENVPILLDEILGDMDRARLTSALEDIVRICAVQDFPPSQSVEFLFGLQTALRGRWKGEQEDWDETVRRTQNAALMAFDLYMACREKIYAVRADETRRRVAQLERVYMQADGGPR